MPESGLERIAAAQSITQLKSAYMSIARSAGLSYADAHWERYIELVQREADDFGITPFEKSGTVFVSFSKPSPVSMVFAIQDDGRVSIPIRASVEVYEKS